LFLKFRRAFFAAVKTIYLNKLNRTSQTIAQGGEENLKGRFDE